MKGLRFYLEHPTGAAKRRGEHDGNVVAVVLGKDGRALYNTTGTVEAVGAVYFYPNSPVCGVGPSPEYLQKRCKRIAEPQARQIHPNLFSYLERPC